MFHCSSICWAKALQLILRFTTTTCQFRWSLLVLVVEIMVQEVIKFQLLMIIWSLIIVWLRSFIVKFTIMKIVTFTHQCLCWWLVELPYWLNPRVCLFSQAFWAGDYPFYWGIYFRIYGPTNYLRLFRFQRRVFVRLIWNDTMIVLSSCRFVNPEWSADRREHHLRDAWFVFRICGNGHEFAFWRIGYSCIYKWTTCIPV